MTESKPSPWREQPTRAARKRALEHAIEPGNVLAADSRAQAIAAGILRDVTWTGSRMGLGPDVAITAGVRHLIERNFPECKQVALTAVLSMAAVWLKADGGDDVRFVGPFGDGLKPEELRVRVGTGDGGATCVTVGIVQDWAPAEAKTLDWRACPNCGFEPLSPPDGIIENAHYCERCGRSFTEVELD